MPRFRASPTVMLAVAAALALTGCGAGGEPSTAPPVSMPDAADGPTMGGTADAVDDAGSPAPADASPDAPAAETPPASGDGGTGACVPGAAVPSPDQPWVATFAADVLAHLTGDVELSAGVRLLDRGSARTRQQARDYLTASLQQLGLTPQVHTYATGANVFAQLNATAAPAPTVVLGAHYDTVAGTPGANDDGSGVAVVLTVARYLAPLPCRSKNVLFVLFDQEEVGLVGSAAFATKLASDGVVVHSVHSVDQVGWDSNHDRLIELERPDPGLRQLYDQAAAELGITSMLKTTSTGGTDHVSFRPRFLAIGVTEGYQSGDTTPYRHQPGDRAATIDLDYLKTAAILVAQVQADLLK